MCFLSCRKARQCPRQIRSPVSPRSVLRHVAHAFAIANQPTTELLILQAFIVSLVCPHAQGSLPLLPEQLAAARPPTVRLVGAPCGDGLTAHSLHRAPGLCSQGGASSWGSTGSFRLALSPRGTATEIQLACTGHQLV